MIHESVMKNLRIIISIYLIWCEIILINLNTFKIMCNKHYLKFIKSEAYRQ